MALVSTPARILIAVLLVHLAPSQDAPATAPASRPDTRALPELESAIQDVVGSDPARRAAAWASLGPLVKSIASEHPDLNPLELRIGAAWRKEERLRVQALLADAFRRLQPALVAEIGSPDAERRRAALEAAAAFGRHARPLVPLLTKMILEGPASGSGHPRGVVRRIGGEADLVPELAAALRSPDAKRRRRAVDALWELSQGFRPPPLALAAAALGSALGDPDEHVRNLAAWMLRNLGADAAPARDALRKLLAEAPASHAAGDAALALHALDSKDASVIPALVAAVTTREMFDRQAAEALGRFGPAASAALPRLVELRTRLDEGRGEAVRAIAAMDPAGAIAVPALIDEAARSDYLAEFAVHELVRRAAASAGARAWLEAKLAGIKNAGAVIEAYRRAPSDPHAVFDVYRALFLAAQDEASFQRALAHVGFDCREGLPLLLDGLDSTVHEVRARALSSFDWFGIEAGPALPRLRDLMRSESPEMRQAVTRAMIAADPGGEATMDDVIARLADPGQAVRVGAIRALGRLGRKAERAAPELRRLAGVDEEYERPRARRALAQVTGDTREIVGEIVSRLLQPEGLPMWESEYLIHDLSFLEPPPLPAVETLAAALEREGTTPEAAHALLLLTRHRQKALPALPAIVRRLTSPAENIRIAAARAIGAIGPEARAAVPALCAALDLAAAHQREDNRDFWLVEELVTAIGLIGPDARAALPHLVMVCAGDVETALERIEPPVRPPIAVRVDPALRVCTGRWRQEQPGWDLDVQSVEAGAYPEPGGWVIGIGQGEMGGRTQSVELHLRRTAAGAIEITGDCSWASPDTSHHGKVPIRGGTIVLRSNDFGSGTPIVGLLTFDEGAIHREIAFTCEDPFRKRD